MTREMIYKLKGANVEVEFTEKEMDGRAMWDIRFDPSLIESEYVDTDEFIDFLSEVISELKRIREWMIETNTKDKDDVVDFVNKVIEYNQQTNN